MRPAKTAHKLNTILERAKMDRRSAIKGGLLLTAAAGGGAFAPAVKASTRAKAVLSSTGPIITEVTPGTVAQGDILTINGHNFGNRIEDICAGVISSDGSQRAILRTLSASDTQITARVHTIPVGMMEGNVVIGTGIGSFVVPSVPSGYVILGEGCIFWRDDGTPPATSDLISLASVAREKVITCSTDCDNAAVGSNLMQLHLTGFLDDCDPGATLSFDAHFTVDDPDGLWPTPSVHFDEFVDLGVVGSPRPVALCMATLCSVYTTIFFNEMGLTNPANNIVCGSNFNPITGDLDVFFELPGNIVFLDGSMCSTLCA